MRHAQTLLSALLLTGCRCCAAFVPTKTKLQVEIGSARHAPSPFVAPERFSIDDSSSTKLFMGSDGADVTDAPSWKFNPLFGALWLGFNAFALGAPFGYIGDPDDTAMIMQYIDNPADPGFSEAFQVIFNYLGTMPIIIACTAVPQAAQRGLPPLPFLVSSFGLGFGGAGPYLSFRAPPKEKYIPSEASWFTRNVLESKLLGWGLVAGVLGVPFYVGFVDAFATDAAAAIQSYTDLFVVSKFVSTSSVDAVVLNVAAASLIPLDLKLRQPDIEDDRAKIIGASTLLLPFLGSALYCALRPALPPKED